MSTEKKLNIGSLNHRITITTPGAMTSDGMGGFTSAAATTRDTWCSARKLSQYEILQYGLLVGSASYKFTLLYNPSSEITQQNGLIYDSRNFRIISINNLNEDNTLVEIIANEQTN